MYKIVDSWHVDPLKNVVVHDVYLIIDSRLQKKQCMFLDNFYTQIDYTTGPAN